MTLESSRVKTEELATGSNCTISEIPTKRNTLTIEECMELLLLAYKEGTQGRLPCRQSASPIDPNINLFYVVEEKRAKKKLEGTSVKYNGFTRAQLWWSVNNPGWGLVCRKMSLKPRNGSNERHGLTGYWLFLANANNGYGTSDTSMQQYCVDGAPNLVQFWTVAEANDIGRFVKGSNDVSNISSPRSSGFDGLQNNSCSPTISPRKRTSTCTSATSIFSSISETVIHNNNEKMSKYDTKQEVNIKKEEEDELKLLGESLLDGHGNEMVDGFNDDGVDSQDSQDSQEVSPFSNDIMNHASQVLSEEEFRKWYITSASTLFTPEISISIESAFHRNDPRISELFMYPSDPSMCCFLSDLPKGTAFFFGGFSCGFNIDECDKEACTIVEDENPRNKPDLYEQRMDCQVMFLFQHLLYKQKLARNQIDPLDFWMQTILRLPSGRRIVVRMHLQVIYPKVLNIDPRNQKSKLQIQDISHLYYDLLALPPLIPELDPLTF